MKTSPSHHLPLSCKLQSRSQDRAPASKTLVSPACLA